MGDNKKTDFDEKAATWDDNPLPVKLASDIAGKIVSGVPLKPDMDVMDFGCGTGLLSFHLRPHVRSITGFDSSRGMLEVFKKKLSQQQVTGVDLHFLGQGGLFKGRYHLVVTSMTLHHIREVKPLLKKFYDALLPSGHLCIADLDLEEGRFHDSHDGIFHFGFDRKMMRGLLQEVGFNILNDVQAAEIMKTGVDGVVRKFTVFLITAQKR